jgi:hypothetical protein
MRQNIAQTRARASPAEEDALLAYTKTMDNYHDVIETVQCGSAFGAKERRSWIPRCDFICRAERVTKTRNSLCPTCNRSLIAWEFTGALRLNNELHGAMASPAQTTHARMQVLHDDDCAQGFDSCTLNRRHEAQKTRPDAHFNFVRNRSPNRWPQT